MADHFTFLLFFTIPSVPLPQFTDSRGLALKAALLSLTISSWSFLPFHTTCVYWIIVIQYSIKLHLTQVYKTVQDYSLPFLLCSQGTVGRVWLNPAKLFTGCCKRAHTGHPSGSLEAHKNVLFDFDMAFNQCNLCWKKKKYIFNITKTQAFIFFWKHYLTIFSSPSLSFSFSSFPVTATSSPVSGLDSQCLSGRGEDYRGSIAITESGNACQHWNTQFPHKHGWVPDRYPCKYAEPHHSNKYQRTVVPYQSRCRGKRRTGFPHLCC